MNCGLYFNLAFNNSRKVPKTNSCTSKLSLSFSQNKLRTQDIKFKCNKRRNSLIFEKEEKMIFKILERI